MERVIGIGGIFFKSTDPKALAKWYEDHLGIHFGNNLYFAFTGREKNSALSPASLSFGIFSDSSDYFDPSAKKLMLNLRVKNLDALLKTLKQEGVKVKDKVDKYAYGNFGWILDPEGNKIELWEPIESGFGEDEKVTSERMKSMKRGTGIGGIFFKSKNNKQLIEWYDKHLGITFTGSAHTFMWLDYNDKKSVGRTVFSIFEDSTKYFGPSQKDFMVNFRVKNLEALMNDLKKEGIPSVGEIERFDYGTFAWIMDPEGNKIELWESVYEKLK